MKHSHTAEAALRAAEEDVTRLLHGCEVPAEYRRRLVAYVQRWYLDQRHHPDHLGHHGVRVCLPREAAGRTAALAS